MCRHVTTVAAAAVDVMDKWFQSGFDGDDDDDNEDDHEDGDGKNEAHAASSSTFATFAAPRLLNFHWGNIRDILCDNLAINY